MCVTYIDFSRFSYLLVGGKVQLLIIINQKKKGILKDLMAMSGVRS